MTARPLDRAAPSIAGATRGLPPEAIVKAIDLIATLARGGMQIAAERDAFDREMESLRTKDIQVRDRLTLLVQLVDHAKLTDDARDRIVEAVCELALR